MKFPCTLSLLSLILFINSLFVHGQEEMYELDSSLKATDAKFMVNMLESTEFYAIQQSESGSISGINSTTHSLQLDNVNEKTIVFSNSPYRKISTQNIENFIGNWTSIQVDLENNHPNAALVLLKENGSKQDVFKIDLYSPSYDREAKNLHYDFTLFGNTNSSQLPEKFATTVLIILDASMEDSEKCPSEVPCQDPTMSYPNLSKCYLIEHQRVACPP